MRKAFILGLGLALAACTAPTPMEAYQRSISAAAVRNPAFAVELRTIPPDQAHVPVATFTEWGAPPSPTKRLTWVSMPDQLRGFCRGKADPVLAIQQTLGLPPQATPSQPDHLWQVITFTVPRSALFRPCPGGTDIGAAQCAANGVAFTDGPRPAGDKLDKATAEFLLAQIWSSHRSGFTTASGAPDWGYPFTGMGWSYNWDPQAASPVGVSEFVLRTGTRIADATPVTPYAFCNPQ